MVDYTPNMKMIIPVQNQTPWTEDMDGNLSIIDAVMGQFIAIPGFTGAWDNSKAFTVGQVVVEVPASTLWQCNISHVSAAAPTTFAQDRTANPTYWTGIGGSGFVVPNAVKKTGDIMSGRLSLQGGLTFAIGAVSSVTDLTRHITLNGTAYGINVTAGTVNVVSSVNIDHVINGTQRLHTNALGVAITGTVSSTVNVSAGLDVTAVRDVNAGRLLDVVLDANIHRNITVSAQAFFAGTTIMAGEPRIQGVGMKYDGAPGSAGHAIAFTWNGTNLRAYVDGSFVGNAV